MPMIRFRRRRRTAASSSTTIVSASRAPRRHLGDSKFIMLIFPTPDGGRAASATVLAEYITCLKSILSRSPPRERNRPLYFLLGFGHSKAVQRREEQARVRRDA